MTYDLLLTIVILTIILSPALLLVSRAIGRTGVDPSPAPERPETAAMELLRRDLADAEALSTRSAAVVRAGKYLLDLHSRPGSVSEDAWEQGFRALGEAIQAVERVRRAGPQGIRRGYPGCREGEASGPQGIRRGYPGCREGEASGPLLAILNPAGLKLHLKTTPATPLAPSTRNQAGSYFPPRLFGTLISPSSSSSDIRFFPLL